jgi:hypothetical protein
MSVVCSHKDSVTLAAHQDNSSYALGFQHGKYYYVAIKFMTCSLVPHLEVTKDTVCEWC